MATTETGHRTSQRLGRIGVWLPGPVLQSGSIDVRRRQVARIESLGYRSLWTGETPGGGDVFVLLGSLLAVTDRLVAGSGIANVWSRPAVTAYGAAATLVDAYPDRFVLGLGVGYPRQAELVGHDYGKPLATMRGYLDRFGAAPAGSLIPVKDVGPRAPVVLAAVGPKMLALAGERTDGAHPFAQPVANTAQARKILGPDKLLIPEQAVAFDPDPAVARRAAREYRERGAAMMIKAGLDPVTMPYGRNLLRLGYTVADITGISDRLVDDVIAHGDEAAIADRVGAHLAAGADHVLVHPVGQDLTAAADTLERLAPALAELETAR
ncbi:MAG TPA: TIGR03620 family F420-dependent LLM class oxidoreductase [Pseudonocardiaceae bacterium]